MAIATKVSIRGDSRGILSLQFMITINKVMSFVDFRYLPFQGDSDNED
jgi:cell cycle checkpoint protein